ncbi:uncharacterized protein ColSpa_11791 [Colletotrichum spaethianum]|uniref:Uncharacterized protein n=1 Tax=Colletotrichum spaethianum TaxID=700344 RepID=A0AA37PGG7_9PEZI|nr:uncharacterized protein ColSpa_11791 [Colletotrichum spaethianum]GKT51610.1 hypothetical protein ColSpa_11791 [Colletotrichum spaethianum]
MARHSRIQGELDRKPVFTWDGMFCVSSVADDAGLCIFYESWKRTTSTEKLGVAIVRSTFDRVSDGRRWLAMLAEL